MLPNSWSGRARRALFLRGLALTLLLAILGGWVSPAVADMDAISRYVEKTGICGGLTPCYLTISQAVAASNPDDQIYVYPGTYTESVNLSTMALMGSINLVTVNPEGMRAPGTVTIAPASGAAIYTSAQFLGAISLSGFVVQSATTNGVNISANSTVVVDHLAANNTHQTGVRITTSGPITVTNSTANGNNFAGENGDGFYLLSNGNVAVQDSTANDNDDEGFDIGANGTVTVENCEANGNYDDGFDIESNGNVMVTESHAHDGIDDYDSDGFDIETNGSATILNTQANGNAQEGVDVQYAGGNVVYDGVTVDSNGTEGLDIDEVLGNVSVLRSSATNNGGDGLQIAEENVVGTTTVYDSIFTGNGWSGVATLYQKGSVWVEKCKAEGNSAALQSNYEGYYLVSALGSVSVVNSVALNNIGPGDSDGFEIGPVDENVLVQNVTTSGNSAKGLNIWNVGGTVTVEDSLIRDNGTQGISLATSGLTPLVTGSVICGNATGMALNYSAAVNAEGNWWGCAAGPGNAGCDVVIPGAGTIDTAPTVDTISGSALLNPVGAGLSTPVKFSLTGGGGVVALGTGPGALNYSVPVFNLTTNNGVLKSSQGTGAAVTEFVNMPGGGVQVILTPASVGSANVVLTGPCGLAEFGIGYEVQVVLPEMFTVWLPIVTR